MDHISIRFDHAGFDADTLASTAQGAQKYVADLQAKLATKSYDMPESFLLLPDDHDIINRILDVATEKEDKNIQGVIVIGIGGSNLGAMAIASAIRPRREMLFLETADPIAMQDVLKKIHAASSAGKYYISILISKSGTTTESIANFGVLTSKLPEADRDWAKHAIVITGESSALWHYATERGMTTVAIPSGVGGRFSVLSAVGLLPLLMAGIPTTHILEGAAKMKSLCLSTVNLEQNPALMGAAVQYLALQQGKGIHNLFVFAPSLEPLGRWWRQLISESLGKDGKGLTPLVSVGSTDLHSMGQLYFDGPKDIITTLVGVKDFGADFDINTEQGLGALIPDIEGKKLSDILNAIHEGARASYRNQGLSYIDVEFGQLSPENLGAFMQWKMMETLYLAHLMQVDPFSQPAVEHYKKETRTILAQGRVNE